jgi:hypothetical protein
MQSAHSIKEKKKCSSGPEFGYFDGSQHRNTISYASSFFLERKTSRRKRSRKATSDLR